MEGLKPLDDKIGGVIENFGCACNSNTSFSDNNLADYLTSFGTMYDETNESNLIENFKENKEEFTSDDNVEDNDSVDNVSNLEKEVSFKMNEIEEIFRTKDSESILQFLEDLKVRTTKSLDSNISGKIQAIETTKEYIEKLEDGNPTGLVKFEKLLAQYLSNPNITNIVSDAVPVTYEQRIGDEKKKIIIKLKLFISDYENPTSSKFEEVKAEYDSLFEALNDGDLQNNEQVDTKFSNIKTLFTNLKSKIQSSKSGVYNDLDKFNHNSSQYKVENEDGTIIYNTKKLAEDLKLHINGISFFKNKTIESMTNIGKTSVIFCLLIIMISVYMFMKIISKKD